MIWGICPHGLLELQNENFINKQAKEIWDKSEMLRDWPSLSMLLPFSVAFSAHGIGAAGGATAAIEKIRQESILMHCRRRVAAVLPDNAVDATAIQPAAHRPASAVLLRSDIPTRAGGICRVLRMTRLFIDKAVINRTIRHIDSAKKYWTRPKQARILRACPAGLLGLRACRRPAILSPFALQQDAPYLSITL
ncbi:hypothetical protein [Collimonas humicola]|uniref:hypothetical protein n=1 Tax=Collimonas humicola TaxID=2825886 RepID=UPI001B8C9FE7|nr:hypothetical protein [Collimonas humicola]